MSEAKFTLAEAVAMEFLGLTPAAWLCLPPVAQREAVRGACRAIAVIEYAIDTRQGEREASPTH
jgi:hypothetical protein